MEQTIPKVGYVENLVNSDEEESMERFDVLSENVSINNNNPTNNQNVTTNSPLDESLNGSGPLPKAIGYVENLLDDVPQEANSLRTPRPDDEDTNPQAAINRLKQIRNFSKPKDPVLKEDPHPPEERGERDDDTDVDSYQYFKTSYMHHDDSDYTEYTISDDEMEQFRKNSRDPKPAKVLKPSPELRTITISKAYEEPSNIDWTKNFVAIREKLMRHSFEHFSQSNTNNNNNNNNNANFNSPLDRDFSNSKLYEKLAALAENFLTVAKRYGKIIISEKQLPVTAKTIQPCDIGGQAGGEKFMVRNIMFKFALDWKGLFKSDELVMKGAGHDLKGLIAIYHAGVPGLHVPLMCVIDWNGYRLTAQSKLPISKKSLVYGSYNAGKIIVNKESDFVLQNIVSTLGARLNLKEHGAGQKGGMLKKLFLPCDMEIHKVV